MKNNITYLPQAHDLIHQFKTDPELELENITLKYLHNKITYSIEDIIYFNVKYNNRISHFISLII